jgi:hypothetical protein
MLLSFFACLSTAHHAGCRAKSLPAHESGMEVGARTAFTL